MTVELVPGSSTADDLSIRKDEIGLCGVCLLCMEWTCRAARLACPVDIFVAILSLAASTNWSVRKFKLYTEVFNILLPCVVIV